MSSGTRRQKQHTQHSVEGRAPHRTDNRACRQTTDTRSEGPVTTRLESHKGIPGGGREGKGDRQNNQTTTRGTNHLRQSQDREKRRHKSPRPRQKRGARKPKTPNTAQERDTTKQTNQTKNRHTPSRQKERSKDNTEARPTPTQKRKNKPPAALSETQKRGVKTGPREQTEVSIKVQKVKTRTAKTEKRRKKK